MPRHRAGKAIAAHCSSSLHRSTGLPPGLREQLGSAALVLPAPAVPSNTRTPSCHLAVSLHRCAIVHLLNSTRTCPSKPKPLWITLRLRNHLIRASGLPACELARCSLVQQQLGARRARRSAAGAQTRRPGPSAPRVSGGTTCSGVYTRVGFLPSKSNPGTRMGLRTSCSSADTLSTRRLETALCVCPRAQLDQVQARGCTVVATS